MVSKCGTKSAMIILIWVTGAVKETEKNQDHGLFGFLVDRRKGTAGLRIKRFKEEESLDYAPIVGDTNSILH